MGAQKLLDSPPLPGHRNRGRRPCSSSGAGLEWHLANNLLQTLLALIDNAEQLSPTVPQPSPMTVRKDGAPAAVQEAMANVAGLGSSSGGGGLIQTTSG